VRYDQGESIEYVSECINVASRIISYTPELYFIAHSNIVTDEDILGTKYVHKQLTKVKGINKSICVYVDEADFCNLLNKVKRSKFRNIRRVVS